VDGRCSRMRRQRYGENRAVQHLLRCSRKWGSEVTRSRELGLFEDWKWVVNLACEESYLVEQYYSKRKCPGEALGK
jgi:hypothetical protein